MGSGLFSGGFQSGQYTHQHSPNIWTQHPNEMAETAAQVRAEALLRAREIEFGIAANSADFMIVDTAHGRSRVACKKEGLEFLRDEVNKWCGNALTV